MNIFKKLFDRQTNESEPRSPLILFFNRNQTAGEPVTHENAYTYSPIWRAVNLISNHIATMPWNVMERQADMTKKHLWTHPAQNLLNLIPNDETDAISFKTTMVAWALTWGNGYAEIERDRAGRPANLWQIDPTRVRPDRDASGRLVYEVNNGTAANSYLNPRDLYHLKGLGYDGLVGYSVIAYAAKTIGLGMATESFGSKFFSNGAHSNVIFEHPENLSDKALEHLKESIKEKYSGDNAFNPMIIEEGMKAEQITIPPEDAQFLETRKFSVADVARWYGIPLHKLHEMDKSSFNNIEQQNIEYVTDALLPWVRRSEMEADIKLISPAARNRVYTKMNLNALLRGDTAARGEWYTKMFNIGAYSPNKILELEDENPIGPEGDKHLVQLNLTTLDKAGEQNEVQNTIPAKTDEEEEEEAAAPGDETAAARAILMADAGRIISRSSHRAADALKRYDGDRAGLVKYLAKFADDQRKYMRNTLSVTLEAFGLSIDLDGFINTHIENETAAILNTFDSGGAMFHVEPATITEQLLESSREQ